MSNLIFKNPNLEKTFFLNKNNFSNLFLSFDNEIFTKNFKQNSNSFFNFFKKNYVYNNFYPLYAFLHNSFFLKRSFFITKNNLVTSSFYSFYLLKFLEIYLKSKFFLKFSTNNPLSEEIKIYFKKLADDNIKWQRNIGKILFLNEFYEIFFMALKYRDLLFLALWLKKKMEKLPIFKHKALAKLLKETLNNYSFFREASNINGFSFDIRGKLGVAGNSKKRHFYFYNGNISYTSKNHGLAMYQTTVRTHTGVLGVTLCVSY